MRNVSSRFTQILGIISSIRLVIFSQIEKIAILTKHKTGNFFESMCQNFVTSTNQINTTSIITEQVSLSCLLRKCMKICIFKNVQLTVQPAIDNISGQFFIVAQKSNLLIFFKIWWCKCGCSFCCLLSSNRRPQLHFLFVTLVILVVTFTIIFLSSFTFFCLPPLNTPQYAKIHPEC